MRAIRWGEVWKVPQVLREKNQSAPFYKLKVQVFVNEKVDNSFNFVIKQCIVVI